MTNKCNALLLEHSSPYLLCYIDVSMIYFVCVRNTQRRRWS